MKLTSQRNNRNGAVAAFFALLLIPMLALVALCVDYGYLLVVKTDLQRAADATVLAAVRDLIPAPDGSQDIDQVKDTIRTYARLNVGAATFAVRNQDIRIGRYDPATIYDNLVIREDGIYDTVQVTLRRDSLANNPVSLFFARIIGITDSEVAATATAVLQKARSLPPGTDILPIVVPESSWYAQTYDQDWSIYGSGKILNDEGNEIPGNFGTLDIGSSNNSTSDLVDQINNGISDSDLGSLYGNDRIDNSTHIGGNEQFWSNADTGLSVGMKSAINANHGETKLVPIINAVSNETGNNLEYLVVGWGVVQLMGSEWSGGPDARNITIKKAFMYDKDLAPNPDLSDTVDIIEAAYTSPVLVD